MGHGESGMGKGRVKKPKLQNFLGPEVGLFHVLILQELL